jgi:hypothetical protein
MYRVPVALDTLQKPVRELNRPALRFSDADFVATCTHETRFKDFLSPLNHDTTACALFVSTSMSH